MILRAAWDYIDRLEEFLDWTTRVPNLANAPEVVAWNIDKRYLADLAEAGVPVVPSRFLRAGRAGKPARRRAGGQTRGRRRICWCTTVQRQRCSPSRMWRSCMPTAATALVQPYDERVEDGETALVFLAGRQSHAFTKGADPAAAGQPARLRRLRHVRGGIADTGRPGLRAVGRRAKRHWPPRPPTWASMSPNCCTRESIVIGGPSDPTLLELELVEPSLGWRQLDAATRSRRQRDFVVGVEDTLERSWPRAALASTPIARRWRRCTRPHRRRGWPRASAGTSLKYCTVPTSP